MRSTVSTEQERHQQDARGFALLVMGLALGAPALTASAGAPHLPSELPSWDIIVLTLRGSSAPYEALVAGQA